MMTDDKKIELLKDEYVMLQKLYEDIDNKGLTIKNWAITVTVAVIGAAAIQGEKNLLWLAAAASLVFWYLEAHWRGLSHFFSTRILQIEGLLQQENLENVTPLQFYNTWNTEYKRSHDQTLRFAFKAETFLPHAIIPVLVVILYFILK
jgi:hypothetical protein